jgi:hypothetical protein
MPATNNRRKIHNSGLPPRDFFAGFMEEVGLVAVVWSSSSSVNSKSGSG